MLQEFDPRRPAFRVAPRVLMGLAGCAVLALGVRLQGAEAHLPGAGLREADLQRIAALQTQAFAEAETRPGMAHAQTVDAEIRSGETFLGAVRRLGVDPAEAEQAVDLLDSSSFDTAKIRAGLKFQAAYVPATEAGGLPHLAGLAMRTGPATQVVISRGYDGAMRLRELTEQIVEETTVVQGDIEGSLYATAGDMGATSAIISQATKLFSHKIDFSREIHDGDTFKLVFTRRVTESGRTVEGLNLLYAEVTSKSAGGQPLKFYRYTPADGGEAEYYDETGKSTRGFLMQTPIGFTRVTSGYGSRLHPVLGYTRMHTGIDFAGATGTPIYAAGDGTVLQAGRNGGYGNWVKIQHADGWQTGYGHMSRFAPGMHAGVHVKQGQLIGYVGMTGTATGPHLHYEVMRNNVKMNPRSAQIPAGGTELKGSELVAFKAQAGLMDTMLAQANTDGATRLAATPSQPSQARVAVARFSKCRCGNRRLRALPSPLRGEGSGMGVNMASGKPAPGAIPRARRLRQTASFAERVLWDELRKLKLNIRRQVPIGGYIVDFAHHATKLVVEVDGPLHEWREQAERDAIRQTWLENEGFRVVRFRGKIAADDPVLVAKQIEAEILLPPSPTLPPSRGKGATIVP